MENFIVSKKYGIAVKRNVFKRRCRAAYNETFVDSIFDCSLIVSPQLVDIGWKQIQKSFSKLSKHIYDK